MRELDDYIDFFIIEKGEDIKINGVDNTGILMDTTEKINYYDDKIILCKTEIKTGDIITYKNFNYSIISEVDKKKSFYKARMRKCSYKIAFNWNGNIKWFYCIEESKVFDVTTDTYISVATGNTYITMQNNADTRNIDLDQRFYVTNQPFKVTGIDKSEEGLIKLNCALDTINTTNDDVENNIADRWKYETKHTYTLSIDNGDTTNVLLNNILTLNITATDNGTSMVNPAVTFTSSDSSIASVDNTGKVMGIAVGQVIITAKLTYHDTIFDSITITIVETVTHSYSITITGSTTIKIGMSQSYVAHIYDNAVEVFDKSVTWSIRNQDGTTGTAYASITTSTGNGATIKAVTNTSYISKYVILKATLSDDATICKEYNVQLKTLI